jgi:hypothetical protein
LAREAEGLLERRFVSGAVTVTGGSDAPPGPCTDCA